MQAVNVKAEPNPRGGQIELSWTNPADANFAGVKVLRRESSMPELLDIGTAREIHDEPAAATPAGTNVKLIDGDLKPETIYYYAVVPYDAASIFSTPAQVSAMTTAPYESAAHLYSKLPGLYRNYDTVKPPDIAGLDARDRERGQLRRLMDMFGPQFDLLRSYASGMRSFHNVERVDGHLLPLLAEWINWQTDSSLNFDKQRNEIRYAPHFFRTTGVPANLRATINRLVTWDARIKEFVHNVYLSTHPEQLTVWEQSNIAGAWQPAQAVTLDVAYEGRPAALMMTDERQLIFYQTRQSAPLPHAVRTSASAVRAKSATEDHWHIWLKTFEQDEWQPSHRVTGGGNLNKYPAATLDQAGRVCLFWTSFQDEGQVGAPQLRHALVGVGRASLPARSRTTNKAPFAFVDGEAFNISVVKGADVINRRVVLRSEHFHNIASVTADEIASVLDREIPGVEVKAAADGALVFTSLAQGSDAHLQFSASAVATELGLSGAASGIDGVAAELKGVRDEPFALREGDSISIKVDGRTPKVVTFRALDFADITQATALEVAAAINRALPGVARASGQRLLLNSTAAGEASLLVVEVYASLLLSLPASFIPTLDGGTLNAPLREQFDARGLTLGTNARIQVLAVGNLWLVSNEKRNFQVRHEGGTLNVYSRALAEPALGLSAPVPPALPLVAESEPTICADSSGVWLFWSSRRNGRWKIWYSRFETGTTLWGSAKMLTTGTDSDREPYALINPSGGGRLWVFWSRKKSNGLWNVFYRTTTNLNFAALTDADWTERELAAVPPDYDNREPQAIVHSPTEVELYFTSNRNNGWQVWTKLITAAAQGADSVITSGQFTSRAPFALSVNKQLRKLYLRTNRSEEYVSSFYPAALTVDNRYSGSTTVDTRNAIKISQRNNFSDVERYTYDTDKGATNWYARDTIGIFLTPDTVNQALVIRRRNQIESVLRKFLPIQLRTVYAVDEVIAENFYTYDDPSAQPQILISEQMFDSILGEVFKTFDDLHVGDIADYQWLRTADAQHLENTLPDLSVNPPDVSFRLPQNGVGEEGSGE
ncbi:MAG: phage tail protein [Pyrinomonadaceae bacterium]